MAKKKQIESEVEPVETTELPVVGQTDCGHNSLAQQGCDTVCVSCGLKV